MRLALRRLLANPSAPSILHSAVHSNGAVSCQYCSNSTATRGQSRRYTTKEKERKQLLQNEIKASRVINLSATAKDDPLGKGAIEYREPNIPKSHARQPNAQDTETEGHKQAKLDRAYFRLRLPKTPRNQNDVHNRDANPRTQLRLPSADREGNQGWRKKLVTMEQYQYQSNLHTPATQGLRLVDHPSHTQDWELWLELIVFRRRHDGAKGAVAIYKEIFRRDLQMPTQGTVANQLWDLLIRAGFQSFELLEEIVVYATRLKWSTTRFWPELYCGIISVVLKKNPDTAYILHVKLKDDFPPLLADYQRIFKLSLDLGRSAHFRLLYKDAPLIGMYKTVIHYLCELQMYAEALKWHEVLYDAGDFPTRRTNIKPLLDHLIYTGDGPRFEKIVRQLVEADSLDSDLAEKVAQMDTGISREIMNRQLGQVHGVAPKKFNDSFCARLFATRLFSVDTIINGLQMMAAEAIGPLSLREIAVRDNCDPGAMCDHLDRLKAAEIPLENSVYCALLRSLAVENKQSILKSVVYCDLHPDAFADLGLQERLLAQYHKENDQLKVERTFAVLTAGCSREKLQMVQTNLVLRCQITLRRPQKVLAILENMKHMGIPVSTRSSRHIRVCWISRRQVGRGAETTKELAILIKASQMTMESGRFVPIMAWREIMRRLGMAGRLMELENLALWLLDWYLSPAAKASLPKRYLLPGSGGQTLTSGDAPPGRPPNRHPRRFLNTLFTTSARHAFVAWGFQHAMKSSRSSISFRKTSTGANTLQFRSTHLRSPVLWTWGLTLLHKLRERGLQIRATEVGRICRHRLDILFGSGYSRRKINRRARSELAEDHGESVYIEEMKAIWGQDLFRVWKHVGRNLERRMGRPRRRAPRRSRREERGNGTDAYGDL